MAEQGPRKHKKLSEIMKTILNMKKKFNKISLKKSQNELKLTKPKKSKQKEGKRERGRSQESPSNRLDQLKEMMINQNEVQKTSK